MNEERNPPEEGPENPAEELQKHLQELLKHARLQFMGSMPGGARRAEAPADVSSSTDAEAEEALRRIREFTLKPRQIRDYLDRFVIQQAEAKKVLAVAICDHYNHVRRCLENPRLREREFAKQNIILLGPTGVGKTYLMRCIAKLIGVPFVKADATKFSETGYVGNDVEDIVRDLVKLARGNLELAQYGILYIDEIDKIAGAASLAGRDVSGRGVQVNLLKLMEETEVNLHSQTDLIGQMQSVMEIQHGRTPVRTINTRHMLFIVSGAFDKLADIVRRRTAASRIGFRESGPDEAVGDVDLLHRAQARDFIEYGFEPEFIGRLPVRVACQGLEVDDLEQILLHSEDSILRQYREDFLGYGIRFEMTREAIRAVAERAAEEKTGARGLMTVLERLFRGFKFELPSTSITTFEVTSETVEDPQRALEDLVVESSAGPDHVNHREIEAFAERFLHRHGLELRFTPEAVGELIRGSVEADRPVGEICENRFKDYPFGLNLIAGHTGKCSFTITREAVVDPDAELSRWVIENYPRDSA